MLELCCVYCVAIKVVNQGYIRDCGIGCRSILYCDKFIQGRKSQGHQFVIKMRRPHAMINPPRILLLI